MKKSIFISFLFIITAISHLYATDEIPEETTQKINVRVASWNVDTSFFDSRDKTEDQRHVWKNRLHAVIKTIQEFSPDILGVQELSPEQAFDLSSISGYKALFLTQTPSEVPVGIIEEGQNVKAWIGKDIGTFLVGILFKEEVFSLEDKGRFWLNENPDELPTNLDRKLTDKGFGNMNTYRAPLWVKLTHRVLDKDLFVFNSHYPLNGNDLTRFKCAQIERNKIEEIAKDAFWISMGDRNIIPREKGSWKEDRAALEPLLRNAHNAVNNQITSTTHVGPLTTFAGFLYNEYKNPIIDGRFEYPIVFDIIVSNHQALRSTHVITEFNLKTGEVVFNPLEVNPERYFASDHLMVIAEYNLLV